MGGFDGCDVGNFCKIFEVVVGVGDVLGGWILVRVKEGVGVFVLLCESGCV